MDGGTNGFFTLFVLQHGRLDLQRDKSNWGSIGGCGQIRWVEVCDAIGPRHAWEARPHSNGGHHFFILLSLFTWVTKAWAGNLYSRRMHWRSKFDAQYCLNVVPFVVYWENPSSSFPATLCIRFVVLLGEQYFFFFFSKRLQLITVKHRHTTIWELTDIREAGTERLNGATAYLSIFPRDSMERNRQPPEHNTSHLANRDQLSKKLG